VNAADNKKKYWQLFLYVSLTSDIFSFKCTKKLWNEENRTQWESTCYYGKEWRYYRYLSSQEWFLFWCIIWRYYVIGDGECERMENDEHSYVKEDHAT